MSRGFLQPSATFLMLSSATFCNDTQPLESDLKKCTESGVVDVPQELLTTIVEAANDSDNHRTIMMSRGFFSRFSRNNDTQALVADLKKCTESGVVDIPQELLTTIVEAANDSDNRRTIMMHLRGCLAEPNHDKKWRRIFAALVLIEALVQKGNPLLLAETAQGHHFDLIQRLSFLENIGLMSDRRVQDLVRRKASSLRTELIPKLQEMEDHEIPTDAIKDNVSTCSLGGVSTVSDITSSTTASSGYSGSATGFGSDMPFNVVGKATGSVVLNGIVTVGHREDTSSDESDHDTSKRRSAGPSLVKNRSKSGRKLNNDATDSDSSSNSGRQPRCSKKQVTTNAAPAVSTQPVETMDLLAL